MDATRLVGILLQRTIRLCLLFFIIASPILSQETGNAKIEKGIEMYRNLDYDNAIKILGDCLTNDKLDTTQQRLAHTYLAQAYHRKELKDPAKKIIKHLLDIDQSYRPDANRDRPSYIELFNEALAEWQSEVAAQQQAGQMSKIQAEPEPRKKNSAKKWLLIGAGAAAGVTVVAVLANRCDHDEKGSMNISW